jgi:hypothetical protein
MVLRNVLLVDEYPIYIGSQSTHNEFPNMVLMICQKHLRRMGWFLGRKTRHIWIDYCTTKIASVNASFDSRFRPFSSADYRRDVHDGVVMCQAASDGGVIHSRKVKLKAGQILGSLAFPDLGANLEYFLIFFFIFYHFTSKHQGET